VLGYRCYFIASATATGLLNRSQVQCTQYSHMQYLLLEMNQYDSVQSSAKFVAYFLTHSNMHFTNSELYAKLMYYLCTSLLFRAVWCDAALICCPIFTDNTHSPGNKFSTLATLVFHTSFVYIQFFLEVYLRCAFFADAFLQISSARSQKLIANIVVCGH